METILQKAIEDVQSSSISFSKYITANDVGKTGGHQYGFHIQKEAWSLFFDKPGTKGSNKDVFIAIKWQDDFETSSRAIYYGSGTRNEYRLTRFGKGFPFLEDDNIGDLLIICKQSSDYYTAFILSSDEDIENFLAALNISATDINGIIPKQFQVTFEQKLINCFLSFINRLESEFPPTVDLSSAARNCYNSSFNVNEKIIKANPDLQLLNWISAEFELFKTIENDRYLKRIKEPFKSVEDLVETANTILNRRKSRAGKSLEHHLAEMFTIFNLKFDTQAVTEDNKKPDFLFPNSEVYHDSRFDSKKIVTLAAKTTCKDRWRQILNEADRVKVKHLFTLQQGISQNQLKEMYNNHVCLVVPNQYLKQFPENFRSKILTLDTFIKKVATIQN